MKKSELKQIIREEIENIDEATKISKKGIKLKLEQILSDLSYIAYDESLKSLEKDSIKLQAEIEKFLKKMR